MKENWTPGPWVLTDVRGVYAIQTLTSNLILELKLKSAEGAVDYDANARLIAAAPDMAEALEKIANCSSYPLHEGSWRDRAYALDGLRIIARDALAKAKGG